MVTEINPDAWQIAKELDEERASGQLRGYAHHFELTTVLRPMLTSKVLCMVFRY